MKPTKSSTTCRSFRISASLATAVILTGCLQTPHTQIPQMQNPQVVVVTPQDQAARLLYNCPNGRTLDVTRVQGSTAALVVIDGKTLRLTRDAAATSAERYTNRLQTLTLFGTSASFESLGQASSGPCMAGVPGAVPGAPGTVVVPEAAPGPGPRRSGDS